MAITLKLISKNNTIENKNNYFLVTLGIVPVYTYESQDKQI